MKGNWKWDNLKRVTSLQMVTLFTVIGGLWILVSDRLLGLIATDPSLFIELSMIRGLLYVGVTTAFFYLLFHWGLNSLQRYRLLVENILEIILFIHPDGRILDANEAAVNRYGYTREELLHMIVQDLYLPEDSLAVSNLLQPVQEGIYFEGRHLCKDRSVFPVEVSVKRAVVNGNPIILSIIRDITERKNAEAAVWMEKERAQVTLNSIGDAVITTDVQGNVEYLNPMAEVLTGWANIEANGLPQETVFHIVNEETGKTVESPIIQCLQVGCIVGLANHTVLIHRKGHSTIGIEDSAAPIRDRDGQVIGAVLVFHDVSEKRALLRRLSHQAHHDALTDLPNRLLFKDRAHQVILQARRHQDQVAVFFLDLDDFKLVNDTLGHAAGDSLLCQVGERLKASLRQEDTVARQGGDEFLILLPELSSEQQAAQVAQKLLDALSAPFQLCEQEIYVTASLGIAIYPVDGEDPEILIQHADTAMYQAKAEGRKQYHFYTLALNERLSEHLTLQNEMRRGLERQEFILYYQPQYRLSDGQFCGMEALVRWQHPERGLLLPGKFITIAEDSGLILPLGEWVLHTACAQNKQWQDLGYPPVRVAVNISARQFRQKSLVSQIAGILAETGLEPKWLELEITESLSMENVAFSVEILQKLKSMGIRLSIDDFGTGFSSLSYLSRFSLNTLKIDRSFIAALNNHLDGQAIVLAIIELAQNLGLKVIAEGVETEAQLNFLRTNGCDEVQGFLLARPVSGEDLVAYWVENR